MRNEIKNWEKACASKIKGWTTVFGTDKDTVIFNMIDGTKVEFEKPKDDFVADRGEQYRRNCIANNSITYNDIKKSIEMSNTKKNRIEDILDKTPIF